MAHALCIDKDAEGSSTCENQALPSTLSAEPRPVQDGQWSMGPHSNASVLLQLSRRVPAAKTREMGMEIR